MHIAVLAEPPVAAGSATAPRDADLSGEPAVVAVLPGYAPGPALAGPGETPGHEAGEPGYTRSQELFDIARFGERMGFAPDHRARTAGPVRPRIPCPPCPRWRAGAATSRTSGRRSARRQDRDAPVRGGGVPRNHPIPRSGRTPAGPRECNRE
ncbi:hypothetical protein [Streptomyces sp. NPDC001070]